MKKSRFVVLHQTIVRCTFWIALFIACICLCIYVIDARTRSVKGAACQWDFVPNTEGLPYSARWCKLTKDTVLLRLYDDKENRLLVERSYRHFDRPNFYWQPDGLGYESQSDGDLIALPPSIFERLRAKLP